MIGGFLSASEVSNSNIRTDGKSHTCIGCGRYKLTDNPRVKPRGKGEKGILIIVPHLTQEDETRGRVLSGSGGKLLGDVLRGMGVDLERDCVVASANACSSKPNPNFNVDCCRKNIEALITDMKPRVIIPMGMASLYSVIGNRYKAQMNGITEWRGWQIPDQDLQCYVCPVWDTTYVIKKSDYPEVEATWCKDLQRALHCLRQPFPKYRKPEIEYLTDLNPLIDIKEGSTVAIDLETTGLKPHALGHRIISASVALNENFAYSFMIPAKKSDRLPFLRLCENPNIFKAGHNIKYETNWMRVIFGVEIQGWQWDSMIAAHLLDNRRYITGLKFQTYVRLGIIDYSSEISPYLQGKGDHANEFNRIDDLLKQVNGDRKLLKYNGMDTINTYRLMTVQMDEILQIPF